MTAEPREIFHLPRPYSLFLEHGSAAKTSISHPQNTASRLEATGYSEFRDYQRKTIEAYLSGKEFFVSAPTGAGKSLTFELAPYTFDHLFGEACNTIVFVIVPLISLMKDQVSNLNSRGIRASYVGDDCLEEQVGDILNLTEKIVFGSPEAILNNYRHIFRHLKRNMKCVFIDESHCIAKC